MAKGIAAQDIGIGGAFLVRPSESPDRRGGFFKNLTEELLASRGVEPRFAEEFFTVSKRGVIRGLHYQRGGMSQAKFIWCYRGEIFDVIVDLRRGSPTFGKWVGTVLSEKNNLILYVPRGFAHGFLALSDEARVLYKADNPYSPKDERGIIYNDNAIGIKWPKVDGEYILSEKDRQWGGFEKCEKF